VNMRIRARGRLVGLLALGMIVIGASTGFAVALAATPGAPLAAAPAGAQNALQLSARQHVLAGRTDPVHGALAPAHGGRTVLIQANAGRGWRTVAHGRTGSNGRFATKWRPNAPRHYGLRAVLTGPGAVTRNLKGGVTAYRPAAASWYGPGLYGSHLACGGTLDAGVVGVANKTMPCGSRVRLRYRGRTVTARVVDRGPYAGGREFDLTAATKQRLGFGSTGTVWASRW
jgi:rare lipoprotein A